MRMKKLINGSGRLQGLLGLRVSGGFVDGGSTVRDHTGWSPAVQAHLTYHNG